MTFPRSLALLLPLALLASCHKSDKNDQRSASGEVLQGSISDDMLPVDKLKSEPPLLAPTNEKGTPEGVADQQSGAEDVTTETSEAPADAATPVTSASSAP